MLLKRDREKNTGEGYQEKQGRNESDRWIERDREGGIERKKE